MGKLPDVMEVPCLGVLVMANLFSGVRTRQIQPLPNYLALVALKSCLIVSKLPKLSLITSAIALFASPKPFCVIIC